MIITLHFIMRKLIILIFLIISISADYVHAQVYPKYPPYSAEIGKNFGFYQRKLKSELKRQHYRRAAINAVHALNQAQKKKRTQKTSEILTALYPISVQHTEQSINTLKEKLKQTTDIDRSVALRYEIWRTYVEFNSLLDSYTKLPSEKQVADTREQPQQAAQEAAWEAFTTSKQQAAIFHYRNALAIPDAPHWETRLARARAIKIASQYQPEHPNINAALAKTQRKGQVKIGIAPIDNRSSHQSISELGYSAISNVRSEVGGKGYSFIQIVEANEQPDVLMRLTITDVRFSKPSVSSYETQHQEVIDEKKEIVARATMTTYTKSIAAHIEYIYTALDTATGDVLSKQTSTIRDIGVFSDTWYSYKGDKRAFGKSDLRKVTEYTQPANVPSRDDLFRETILPTKQQLSNHAIDFCNTIGY